jgi:hypothetical protein
VEQGSYDGRPAIVLVTIGRDSGSDTNTTFTKRLYLDPETFLPIVTEIEGSLDYGEVVPLRGQHRFTHDVVAADSVPDDFFEPAAIGYVEPNPEPALDASDFGLTVYWLGQEFAPESDLPALTLDLVEIPQQDRSGYRAILHYRSLDDRFGPALISLQQWPKADWDASAGPSYQAHWDNKPCQSQEDIALDGGRARIYMGYDELLGGTGTPEGGCREEAFNSFGAVVEYGETVVMLGAPATSGPDGITNSPYNSRAGMEAVIYALQPREPESPASPTP